VIASVCGLLMAASTIAAQATTSSLPKDFPKPPHSKVLKERVTTNNRYYVLVVNSDNAAAKYLTRRLPHHGWKVSSPRQISGSEKIYDFTGHGYGGRDRTSFSFNTNSPKRMALNFHRNK
jgi:hypothetical protein